MTDTATIDERQYLDPVFLKYGMEVYAPEYIDLLRKENLELKIDHNKKMISFLKAAVYRKTELMRLQW